MAKGEETSSLEPWGLDLKYWEMIQDGGKSEHSANYVRQD